MDVLGADFGLTMGDDWTADELQAQEAEFRLPGTGEGVGIELGHRILERGERDALPIAFEVHLGDRLVFRAALPGSTAENDRYIAAKLALARETGHATLWSSRLYRDRLAADPALKDERRAVYGPFGGCVPLRAADGSVAGYAVVSGLSEQDDHAMIVWALRSLGGRPTAAQ